MNMVLWVLQILGALLYLSSGVMKVFMFDKVSAHVKYREMTPIIMSAVLGIVMAFIAYGRSVLQPIV